jgi:hypothetical protein
MDVPVLVFQLLDQVPEYRRIAESSGRTREVKQPRR